MFKVPGRCYTSKIHLYNRPTADFVLATTTRAAPVLCKFPSLVSSWTSLRYSCVFIISAHPASSADAREIGLAPKKCSFQERLSVARRTFFGSQFGDRDAVKGRDGCADVFGCWMATIGCTTQSHVHHGATREIKTATRFRVATFTRTILPFHKMPNTTPIGLFPTTTINRKNGVTKSCVM